MSAELRPDEARRLALRASGATWAHPARVTAGTVLKVARQLGVIQIDSVNVVARAHEMPVYSRQGPYDPTLLARLAYRERRLFEYWGHEASFMPIELEPLLRWRKRDTLEGRDHNWWARWTASHEDLLAAMLRVVTEDGPTAASDHTSSPRGKWWGLQDERVALQWLFSSGQLAVANRRSSFEREYDLPERVFPPEILNAPTPSPDDAKRGLLERAIGALGVATPHDLADHFRIPIAEVRRLIPDLVAGGSLVETSIEGWKGPVYRDPQATIPRQVGNSMVLSPFDPIVWNRKRTERLFGFRYRIEIYVPAPKRVHGYYVLPYLCDEVLAARVDLKADRASGVLRVLGAWGEPGGPADTVTRLRDDLDRFAAQLGLESVAVAPRGDLSRALARTKGPRTR